MEVSRGANLVGMSVFPLDACPFSLLSKKKIIMLVCVDFFKFFLVVCMWLRLMLELTF